MTIERLTEITKEKALEGRHLTEYLFVSPALAHHLLTTLKPTTQPLGAMHFSVPLMYELLGIPIIIDTKITDISLWLLLDAEGKEVERGNVSWDPGCPHGYKLGEPCGICGTGVPNGDPTK